MGIKTNTNSWVYILKEAQLFYRPADINRFVKLWNDGESITAIAEKLNVKKTDVALLVMDSEIEGRIKPRPGGLMGTKPHKWKQKAAQLAIT
jgi:hypothetical protein